MRKPSARSLLVRLAIVVLLTGCSLAPKSDPSQFYVLNSVVTPQAASIPAGLDGAIGVGPISFPEYLRRPQMVTRVGPNEIAYAEYDRWAQSLEGSFARVLGENLASLLGGVDIATHPWFASTKLSFAVEVEVIRFERDATGAAELHCTWVVRQGQSRERLDGAEFNRREPAESRGTGGSVAAQSRLVGELSREIAVAIRGLAAR